MKKHFLVGWASTLILSALTGAVNVEAQETTEVEQLRRQLQQANEAFQKSVEQYRQVTGELSRRLEELQRQSGATPPATASPASPASTGLAGTNGPAGAVVDPASAIVRRAWSPADPIRVAGGSQNYLNLSFDALFAAGWSSAEDVESLQLGGHDPKQRGFTVQNLETTFSGQVDPYFRGQANIILQIDPEGETVVEAEEAYLESMALPWDLQVKAGQYFTEFGRLNPSHPHTWDFVDQPLVNGRFFGPDGLRNPGARLSWLVPTPFFSELLMSVQNSQGETAESFRSDHEGELFFGRPAEETRVKGAGDLLYAPRYAVSLNLSDESTVVLGASGAFGPNSSGKHTDTQIYGADLFYKWKPSTQSKGWPFVTWQTEWMYRSYEAGAFGGDVDHPALPAETLRDWGFYSQVSYGFRRGWVASLRGDLVTGERGRLSPDEGRDERWRLSPALTIFPTEFSKVRLQYNYDDRENIGTDHGIWLQFEFLLGAHAAHRF